MTTPEAPDVPDLPSDDELMLEIRRLWETLDPPPGDLADGVLATLAAIDLEFEFELMTLVDSHDVLAGTRSSAAQLAEVGQWSLEFAAPDFRVLLRISTANDRRRIDGWVLPRLPMRIQVAGASSGHPSYDGVEVDAHGRFELTNVSPGLSRLWVLPEPGSSGSSGRSGDQAPLPIATPPFWI
jgi:hypothetical protein